MKWGAVITACELVPEPLATAIGTPRKALARIGDRTLLSRAMDAVRSSDFDACVTVGGEDVRSCVDFGEFVWSRGPMLEAASAGVASLKDVDAVMVLPGDLPFLVAESLQRFRQGVERTVGRTSKERLWFAAGLCHADDVQEAFPSVPAPRSIRLKEGAFIASPIYACSPRSFESALGLAERAHEARSRPLHTAWRLGPLKLLRFFWHKTDFPEAQAMMSQVLGGEATLLKDADPRSVVEFHDLEAFQAVVTLHAE